MNTKKYYLIYQVTNNVNGKIYIGKHETNRLDDDYMGSGKILKRAQDKYGIENFTFNVLIYLHNREEMCLLERMVVSKEFCERTDTYNINVGGDGGWEYINHQRKYDETYNQWCKNVSNGLKRKWKESPEVFYSYIDPQAFKGRHHSEETKKKMSEKAKLRTGDKNSSFGTVWIYNETLKENKSVKKELVDEFINEGWMIGRKMEYYKNL